MRITIGGTTSSPAAAIRAQPRSRRARSAPPDGNGLRLNEFAERYDQYFPKVFAYVYGRVQDKEASLDIVSDVFEKAFVKMHSLRSAGAFGSWLFTIARNEIASHWRKEKPAAKAVQEMAWENEFNHQPRSPEESLLLKERIDHLTVLPDPGCLKPDVGDAGLGACMGAARPVHPQRLVFR